jgi:hypothetical protein
MNLETYLHAHCARPTTVAELFPGFVAELPPADASWWTRSRFIGSAIRLGYELGILDRRQALYPPIGR